MRAQTTNPFNSGYRRVMLLLLAPGLGFLMGALIFAMHADYGRTLSGTVVPIVVEGQGARP